MAAAFGTTDDRKLDTTVPSVVKNPGPGAYTTKERSPESQRSPQAVFKSSVVRKENMAGNPAAPSPTAYNLADYNSVSRKPLQGGAPNNILSLQKAETKKMIDQMFPFLVKGRMEDDSRTLEMANIGPGSYSPSNANLNTATQSSIRLKANLSLASGKSKYLDKTSNKVIDVTGGADKNACFGSGQGRFDEQEKLLAKAPSKVGPGAYSNVNFVPKGSNFSTRFINQTSGNI